MNNDDMPVDMTYTTNGVSASLVEVTNISPYGFWLLIGEEELFLPYSEFPWFKEAPVSKICNVELHHQEHLYWPSLDIDLSIESIRNPDAFPLVSMMQTSQSHTTCIYK